MARYCRKDVSMNKIVIIDDHQLFLYGLKLTLENEGNLVTTFDSPLKALTEIKDINPDLILIDLYMSEMSGIAMLEALMKAKMASPVVVLSASECYSDVYHALQNGAMGFIPKSYSPQELIYALDRVFAGDLFVPEDIMVEIESVAQLEEKSKQDYHLSDRQIQILRLLQDGKKNREIADALCISQDTVKFHQKGLYLALDVSGASSRLQAVEKAISIGLLKA
ncbi:response regulator transcription factor [Psychromonas sp. RZ5]|nr:response regulator transcription factor [Psychromonas sp. RZ5]